ncbi:hypothetical protein ACN20G_35040 (plasmid) [Streptomyces sp. BI20]|uniref:hypothetical protein n=1 Tax=Streptomyces sp. BI20 TaxID=3403460 RepID=UPI003C742CA7
MNDARENGTPGARRRRGAGGASGCAGCSGCLIIPAALLLIGVVLVVVLWFGMPWEW